MPMIQLGEWLPDQNPVALPGLLEVNNVYPTLHGYRSFNGRNGLGNVTSLQHPCVGARSGDTQAGSKYTVVATREAGAGLGREIKVLWNSGDWKDATPQAGEFDTLANECRVSFATYGDRLIAVGPDAKPCSVDTASSPPSNTNPFAELHVDAPFASVCEVFKEFLILGDIVGRGNNPAYATQRAGLHWSAIGNPTLWPTAGTQTAIDVQSDFQILDGDGGPITAIVSAGEWCAVLRERQVWRMDYVGGRNFFSFRKLDSNRGCNITGAAIAVGGVVYFPSAEGFLACDGNSLHPIGEEKVDRYWREFLDHHAKHRASAVYNAETESIYWSLPDGSNDPTTILGYRPILQKWFRLTEQPHQALFDSVSSLVGGNLDELPWSNYQMDSSGGASLLEFMNLDTMGIRDGDRAMAVIDGNGDIKLYNDTNDTLTGSILTGDYEMPDGGRAMLRWIRPVFEGDSPMAGYAAGRLRANGEAPLQPLTWMDEAGVFSSQGAESVWVSAGFIPGPWGGDVGSYTDAIRRVGGRYLRAKFVFGSPVDKFSGFDFEIRSSSSPSRSTR